MRCSSGNASTAPSMASGRRPPSRAVKRAPVSAKGCMTRAIGRLRRLASPVMTEKIGWLARMPHSRRAAVPELPMSSTSCGSRKRAQPGANHPPLARRILRHRCAKRPHGGRGAQHILTFQQAGNTGLANGQRREHQGAVGNRFVAGNVDGAGQGRGAVGGEHGAAVSTKPPAGQQAGLWNPPRHCVNGCAMDAETVPPGRFRLRPVPLLVTVALGVGLPYLAAYCARVFSLVTGLASPHGDILPWLYVQHGFQLVWALAAIAIIRRFVPADYGLHWPARQNLYRRGDRLGPRLRRAHDADRLRTPSLSPERCPRLVTHSRRPPSSAGSVSKAFMSGRPRKYRSAHCW